MQLKAIKNKSQTYIKYTILKSLISDSKTISVFIISDSFVW